MQWARHLQQDILFFVKGQIEILLYIKFFIKRYYIKKGRNEVFKDRTVMIKMRWQLYLMKCDQTGTMNKWKIENIILYKRWPWHILFWLGYALFRFWVYYITVTFYNRIYLEYMLLSEIIFVGFTYLTIWLYKRLFANRKYLIYFLIGIVC